jgi:hypothetical protein
MVSPTHSLGLDWRLFHRHRYELLSSGCRLAGVLGPPGTRPYPPTVYLSFATLRPGCGMTIRPSCGPRNVQIHRSGRGPEDEFSSGGGRRVLLERSASITVLRSPAGPVCFLWARGSVSTGPAGGRVLVLFSSRTALRPPHFGARAGWAVLLERSPRTNALRTSVAIEA